MTDMVSCVETVVLSLTLGLYLLTCVKGEDYLLAFHGHIRPIIRVVTSNGRGVIDVLHTANVTQTTHVFTAEYERHTVELDPSLFTSNGIENKVIIVTLKFDSQISIFGSDYYRSFFTPLLVRDLGTNYLISTCKRTLYLTQTLLVLATPSKASEVNITFKSDNAFTHDGQEYRTGDSMIVSLARYQTFTIKISADITGSVIASTKPIAVYVGNLDPLDGQRLSYDQLLPSNLLGHSYVAPTFSNGHNEISVISLHDTSMLFNGTEYVLNKNVAHRISVVGQQNIHITTGKPSLVLLCYTNSYPYTSLLVVPPYSAYVTKCTLPILENPEYRILTRNPAGLLAKGSASHVIPVNWQGVYNSTFYAGTFTVTCFNVVMCESESRFAFIFLEDNLIYGFHCGYNFSSGVQDENITYPVPSTTTLPPDYTTPDPCITTTAGPSTGSGNTASKVPPQSTTVHTDVGFTDTSSTGQTTTNPGGTHPGDDNNDDDRNLTIGLGVGIPLIIIIIIIIIMCVLKKKKKKEERKRRERERQLQGEADRDHISLQGFDNYTVGSRESSIRYEEIRDPENEDSYCHVEHLQLPDVLST